MSSIEGPLFLTTTLLYSREMSNFVKRSYIHHNGRTLLLKKLDWLYGLVCFADTVRNPNPLNLDGASTPVNALDHHVIAMRGIQNEAI